MSSLEMYQLFPVGGIFSFGDSYLDIIFCTSNFFRFQGKPVTLLERIGQLLAKDLFTATRLEEDHNHVHLLTWWDYFSLNNKSSWLPFSFLSISEPVIFAMYLIFCWKDIYGAWSLYSWESSVKINLYSQKLQIHKLSFLVYERSGKFGL